MQLRTQATFALAQDATTSSTTQKQESRLAANANLHTAAGYADQKTRRVGWSCQWHPNQKVKAQRLLSYGVGKTRPTWRINMSSTCMIDSVYQDQALISYIAMTFGHSIVTLHEKFAIWYGDESAMT